MRRRADLGGSRALQGCPAAAARPDRSRLSNGADSQRRRPIDRRSFNLGIIAAFAEIVGAGVKTLALSDVLPPQEADALEAEAGRIAHENGIRIHREPDLLVTDLFPADVAAGKHVFLIYKGTTLDDYRRLKEEKARLEREGRYDARPAAAWPSASAGF